jgi:4-amino-4-deoxy-L-arabinose transferase-like glycosyltransferase
MNQATRRRVFWILGVVGIAALAIAVRVAFLMDLGFNSDEAVYAGQAASIAGDSQYLPYFPIFRAHPLLFQTVLSIPYQWGVSPLVGRLVAVGFGLGTVVMIYLTGTTLYSRRVGAIAALILAVMPYHVIVTRQVLLDGPLTFFATLCLFFMAKFGATRKMPWFYAAFGALGLTFLAKEAGVLLLGAIYVFVALFGNVRFRQIVIAGLVFVAVVLPYPLSIVFSGRSTTGEQFLAWQLLRRANHTWEFYFVEVPPVIGWLVLAAALLSVIYLLRRWHWQETLLAVWILVPLAFFELWPVKGFQYLLPLAPPIVIFASRGIVALWETTSIKGRNIEWGPWLGRAAVVVVVASLAVTSWLRIQPASGSTEFLAGSGGVPGGREAGEWVAANIPEGAELLALGPSMANIIQFYGNRRAFGLSVSPNPLHRNPVYEPVNNPDLRIRSNDLQYIVWDSFSASRSAFFSDRLLTYVERYHGRPVHTEYVEVRTDDGATVAKPVIVIYEVRP